MISKWIDKIGASSLRRRLAYALAPELLAARSFAEFAHEVVDQAFNDRSRDVRAANLGLERMRKRLAATMKELAEARAKNEELSARLANAPAIIDVEENVTRDPRAEWPPKPAVATSGPDDLDELEFDRLANNDDDPYVPF